MLTGSFSFPPRDLPTPTMVPLPARPLPRAWRYDLTLPIDHLPLFPGTSALAFGEVGIGFDRDGGWGVRWIEHAPYTGKVPVAIPEDHPLYRLIRDAIQVERSEEIAARIGEELDAMGFRVEPLCEPLTGRDYGVGAAA